MEENKEEVKEFEEIELDWSVYVNSIESSINELILQAFNQYGYTLDYLTQEASDITIIPYSHDHIVYAAGGIELFAVHSHIMWDNKPGTFVHGTIHYEIVNIKEL